MADPRTVHVPSEPKHPTKRCWLVRMYQKLKTKLFGENLSW